MPSQSMYGNAPQQQQQQQPQAAQQDLSVVLVTGSYDHEIRFWEAWSGICSRTIARSGEQGIVVFEGHTGNVTAVCFHAEGKWVVTGSEDSTIRIWDLR
ncbi:TOR complex subunit lst8 [Tulasnella sp. 427]|nr:TOR complex subunit lst8 [Tulasnella sp. 427]